MSYLISWECVIAAAVLLPSLLITLWHLRQSLAALFMPRVKNPATFKFQKKRSSLPRIKKPFSVDPVTRHAKL
jgi:hypothetical protein